MFLFLSLLTGPAQAQQCDVDSDCATNQCIEITTFYEDCYPFPWGPFCDVATLTTGTCAEDGPDQLENQYTDECMRPVNGGQGIGVEITMSECNNSSSRQWWSYESSPGLTTFQNRRSELCLTKAGSNYYQNTCTGASNQQFDLDFHSDGSFRIFHPGTHDSCIRAHPTLDDPFKSTTCDVNNTSSRRWRWL